MVWDATDGVADSDGACDFLRGVFWHAEVLEDADRRVLAEAHTRDSGTCFGGKADCGLCADDDVAVVTLQAVALLFDMDGTLVDSNAAVERAWAFWCRRYQLNLEEVLHFSHGRPTLATMDHFGARFAPGKDWSEEADEMQRMELADLGSTKAIGGARELLAQLDDSRWAVVTSAPRQLAEIRIQAAGLPLPKLLVPADEISSGKPHPEGYLKAASKLGVPADECVVFEDTPPGVEAGLNAGMQVIGLLTTVTAERLRTGFVIRDYSYLRVTPNEAGYKLEISS